MFNILEKKIIQGTVQGAHEVISSVPFGGGSHYLLFHKNLCEMDKVFYLIAHCPDS